MASRDGLVVIPPDTVFCIGIADNELVLCRTTGVLSRNHSQGTIVGYHALAEPDRHLEQLRSIQVVMHLLSTFDLCCLDGEGWIEMACVLQRTAPETEMKDTWHLTAMSLFITSLISFSVDEKDGFLRRIAFNRAQYQVRLSNLLIVIKPSRQ